MTTEELARLLNNLLRIGTVSAVDAKARAVRVRDGEIETDWLRWLEVRAGSTTDWDPPTLGEQVIVLSPGGDLGAGVVLAGINSQPIPRQAPTLMRQCVDSLTMRGLSTTTDQGL